MLYFKFQGLIDIVNPVQYFLQADWPGITVIVNFTYSIPGHVPFGCSIVIRVSFQINFNSALTLIVPLFGLNSGMDSIINLDVTNNFWAPTPDVSK